MPNKKKNKKTESNLERYRKKSTRIQDEKAAKENLKKIAKESLKCGGKKKMQSGGSFDLNSLISITDGDASIDTASAIGMGGDVVSSFSKESAYDPSPYEQSIAGDIAGSVGPLGSLIEAGGQTLEAVGSQFNEYNEYGYNENEGAGAVYSVASAAFDPMSQFEQDIDQGDYGGAVLDVLGFGMATAYSDYQKEQKEAKRKEAKANREHAMRNHTAYFAKNGGMKKNYKNGGKKDVGGEVQGPGTGKSDDVPAKIPNKAFIIPADADQKIVKSLMSHIGEKGKSNANTSEKNANSYVSDGENIIPPEKVPMAESFMNKKGMSLNDLAPNAKEKLNIAEYAMGGPTDPKDQIIKYPKEMPAKGDMEVSDAFSRMSEGQPVQMKISSPDTILPSGVGYAGKSIIPMGENTALVFNPETKSYDYVDKRGGGTGYFYADGGTKKKSKESKVDKEYKYQSFIDEDKIYNQPRDETDNMNIILEQWQDKLAGEVETEVLESMIEGEKVSNPYKKPMPTKDVSKYSNKRYKEMQGKMDDVTMQKIRRDVYQNIADGNVPDELQKTLNDPLLNFETKKQAIDTYADSQINDWIEQKSMAAYGDYLTQENLRKKEGYAKGGITKSSSPEEIKRFQRYAGIEDDGLYGPQTEEAWNVLGKEYTAENKTSTETLAENIVPTLKATEETKLASDSINRNTKNNENRNTSSKTKDWAKENIGFAELAGAAQIAAGLDASRKLKEPELKDSTEINEAYRLAKASAGRGLSEAEKNMINKRFLSALRSGVPKAGISAQGTYAKTSALINQYGDQLTRLAATDEQLKRQSISPLIQAAALKGRQDQLRFTVEADRYNREAEAAAGMINAGINNIIGSQKFKTQQETFKEIDEASKVNFGSIIT